MSYYDAADYYRLNLSAPRVALRQPYNRAAARRHAKIRRLRHGSTYTPSASSSATFTTTASVSGGWPVSASDSATFSVTPGHSVAWVASASSSATFTTTAGESVEWIKSASDSATFSMSTGKVSTWPVSASSSATFGMTTSNVIALTESASSSATFSGVASSAKVSGRTGSDSATFTTAASNSGGHPRMASASDGATFTDSCAAYPYWTIYRNIILGTAGLIHFWEMEEVRGTTAFDSADSQNCMTEGSDPPTMRQLGIPAGGYCYLFNGLNNNAGSIGISSLSSNPSAGVAIPGTGISVEAWIYLSAPINSYITVVGGTAVTWGPGGSEYFQLFELYLTANNPGSYPVMAQYRIWAGETFAVSSPVALTPNSWNHLVGTLANASYMDVYVNAVASGIAVDTSPNLNSDQLPNAYHDPVYFQIGEGYYGGDAYFKIDEVAIYNVPLTPTQILQHWEAGNPPQSIPLSASDSFVMGYEVASARTQQPKQVQASDKATFTTTPSYTISLVVFATGSAKFFESVTTNGISVQAADSFVFTDIANGGNRKFWPVSASDSAKFSSTTSGHNQFVFADAPEGPDIITFTDVASENRIGLANAADIAIFSDEADAVFSYPVRASDSFYFYELVASNHFFYPKAKDSFYFTDRASVVYVPLGASDLMVFSDRATGENISGSLRVLATVSQEYPLSYAESSEGLIVIANGVDPVIAWDGVSEEAWQAGVMPPDTVTWMESAGPGVLTGVRYAFTRFVDVRGNLSNLSPVSDPIDLGWDGFVNNVLYDQAGVVTIWSRNHRLTSGAQIIITGIDDETQDEIHGGVSIANGTWTIDVVDDDSFTIRNLTILFGRYKSGGIWVMGSYVITYQNVPVPEDTKVVRRQILRNLEGSSNVLYVDIDTTDLATTTFHSNRTDEDLATSDSIALQFEDGEPSSQRYYPPPSHKLAVAAYAGRIWATADLIYSDGNVQVAYGSQVVVGIGTAWTSNMAGRLLYVGSGAGQTIQSVNAATQMLVLDLPFAGQSAPYTFYFIRPAPIERRLVYFSEPGLPEAWPPWNAFAVPESSDEIVGLFVLRSYLFIAKERNIYKFSYRQDPGTDGYVFPVAARGCVNNRCAIQVEATYYLLDEQGIYSFDGDAVQPISQAVSSLFKDDGSSAYRVDWTTDRLLWNAAHDPIRQSVRWFVDLVGFDSLTYAICYDYRRGQWWLEQYPEAVSASALSVVNGYRQSITGTTAKRVFCLGQGTLDGIAEDSAGTLRGTATSGTTLGLYDASANFPGNLAGVPVAFVSGAGAEQLAIVSSNTTNSIEFVWPVDLPPDETTVYQVGGVPWTWKSGWRQVVDDEADNPRDLEFTFKPTTNPGTVTAKVYHDHSSTPESWGYTIERDGISVVEGSPSMVIDLASPRGYAIQRISGHRDPYGYGHRYMALELDGVQGIDPHRIFRLVMNGVE